MEHFLVVKMFLVDVLFGGMQLGQAFHRHCSHDGTQRNAVLNLVFEQPMGAGCLRDAFNVELFAERLSQPDPDKGERGT